MAGKRDLQKCVLFSEDEMYELRIVSAVTGIKMNSIIIDGAMERCNVLRSKFKDEFKLHGE